MVKSYKYNDKTQLSEHFNVQEFRCKCGKTHDILIADETVALLEKLIEKFGARACNIYSGHRCASHDKYVGGRGAGSHVQGYAVDCYFVMPDGSVVNSRDVVLALEDMGHQCGIGYRCGNSQPKTGYTHIDTMPRKWFGDESVSMTKSVCSSFYEYFGIPKKTSPSQTWTPGKYKLTVSKAIRKDHILSDNIVKVGRCAASVRKNLTSKKWGAEAFYKVGTIVDITEIYVDETTRVWGKLQNCWIVLCNKDGSPQAKKN